MPLTDMLRTETYKTGEKFLSSPWRSVQINEISCPMRLKSTVDHKKVQSILSRTQIWRKTLISLANCTNDSNTRKAYQFYESVTLNLHDKEKDGQTTSTQLGLKTLVYSLLVRISLCDRADRPAIPICSWQCWAVTLHLLLRKMFPSGCLRQITARCRVSISIFDHRLLAAAK